MWLAIKMALYFLHKLHRKSEEVFASYFDCMVWAYTIGVQANKVTPVKLPFILVLFPKADIEK